MSSFKKYYSIFLLGIFLFAYGEKSVHDILHADDAHCYSQTEKHFHNQEHHCYICDFDFPAFNKASTAFHSSFIRCSTDVTYLFTEQNTSLQGKSTPINRGPPAIA